MRLTTASTLVAATVLAFCPDLYAASGQAASPAKTQVTSEAYAKPHQMITVSPGRGLDLFCLGQGSPTVIFETGFGSEIYDWRFVHPSISRVTRACVYSRAGYGFSDPPSRPVDARNVVDDLHRLIKGASISTPIILVGHSIGGLYATLYAETYSADVAGMVLIDPSFAGETRLETAGLNAAEQAKFIEAANKERVFMGNCLRFARSGVFEKPDGEKSVCLDNPPDLDPIVHQALNRDWARATTISAIMSEADSASASGPGKNSPNDQEVDSMKRSFGAMPLVVLTAATEHYPTDAKPNQAENFEQIWKAGHDELAARSTSGKSMLVSHSGHFIQKDQPSIVIGYVDQVISEVRHPNIR